MKNALARSLLASLTLLTSVAPIPRVAHACGGYGASPFSPDERAVRSVNGQLFIALSTGDRASALALALPDAVVHLPQHRGSCCYQRPAPYAQWVSERVNDRGLSLGGLANVTSTDDQRFVAHWTGSTYFGAAVIASVSVRRVESALRIERIDLSYPAR